MKHVLDNSVKFEILYHSTTVGPIALGCLEIHSTTVGPIAPGRLEIHATTMSPKAAGRLETRMKQLITTTESFNG